MKEFGTVSFYSDQGPAVALNWFNDERTHFTCLFLSSDFGHRCGLDVEVGDGTVRGADFSKFSTLYLAVEYNGPAEQFRISFRNAFENPEAASDTKYHQFMAPVREGAYVYEIPFAQLQVPSWWKERTRVANASMLQPDRSNIIHLGFDIETPMPIGQHHFKVLEFSASAPWLALNFNLWLAASCIYIVVVGAILYFVRIRVQLKVHTEEMFGLLRKLEQADTESSHFKKLSMYDPLTGLLNRRAALDLMQDFGARNSLAGTALLVLDIDHFKQVNDTYGHDLGDEVLKKVSATVQESIREGDAAIRWGGEEIVIICPNTSQSGAIKVAEKLRESIKELVFSETNLRITASFGVASIAARESFDQAFRRADEALYQAKNNGRDRVCRPKAHAAA